MITLYIKLVVHKIETSREFQDTDLE